MFWFIRKKLEKSRSRKVCLFCKTEQEGVRKVSVVEGGAGPNRPTGPTGWGASMGGGGGGGERPEERRRAGKGRPGSYSHPVSGGSRAPLEPL